MHVAVIVQRQRIVVVRVADYLLGLGHEAGEATSDVVEVAATFVTFRKHAHSWTTSGTCSTHFAHGEEHGLFSNGINLLETASEFLDSNLGSNVLGVIIVKLTLNAHPVESVVTRKNVELLFEYRLEA